MSFNNISHINFFSKKYKDTIDFFEMLGMSPKQGQRKESSNWFGFDTGETTFAVEPMENHDDISKKYNINRSDDVLIQFKADDLEELKSMTEVLKTNKVKILDEMIEVSYGVVTRFIGPDDMMFEILLD